MGKILLPSKRFGFALRIRKAANRIVELFDPECNVLLVSYARGEAKSDSAVDLLVVMPTRNEIDHMVRIWRALDLLFAFGNLVQPPSKTAWRLKEGDGFLREVMARGKVLL